MKKLYALALVAAALACNLAMAQGIQLGEPAVGGNGCPAGSVSAAVSPDASSVSILFDQFIAQAGRGLSMDRKSCNIAIPVHVPAGLSVSILKVDYRGFNSLPAGAMSRVQAEYFFAGTQGPHFMQNFRGPLQQDYLFTNSMVATAWSACGADTILRVNASALVQTNRYGDDAMTTVDSADASAALVFALQYRSCF